jgi:hypothetical protein
MQRTVLRGCRAAVPASHNSAMSLFMPSAISVFIAPGSTITTSMSNPRSSWRSASENPSSANFDEQYADIENGATWQAERTRRMERVVR